MLAVIYDDVRRLVLGLLFVVAFGWMAAQLLPGSAEPGGLPQLAEAGVAIIPPAE